MDRVTGNFTGQESRSFPLDCETLQTLQDNTNMVAALGNIWGDKTILLGCEEKAEGGRNEGYIFIRTTACPTGEVLRFTGSEQDDDYLHLTLTTADVVQGDVTYKGAYTTRQLEQGQGEEQWAWDELTRPDDVEAMYVGLKNEMATIRNEVAKIQPVPLGVVEMFSGKKIPDNYALCDGQALSKELYSELYDVIGDRFFKEGTDDSMFCLPDLRGRFIAGYDSSDADYNMVGRAGGEKAHTLSTLELPSHSHSVEDAYYAENLGLGGKYHGSKEGVDADNDLYTRNITTGETGDGRAHENRPPYFVLMYIMRLK